MEGEREQQEEREAEKGRRGEDIHGAEISGELQAPQALRQQRGLESSLCRSRLDRRRRRHHLQKGSSPPSSFSLFRVLFSFLNLFFFPVESDLEYFTTGFYVALSESMYNRVHGSETDLGIALLDLWDLIR